MFPDEKEYSQKVNQAFSQFRIVFIRRFCRRRKLLLTLHHEKLNAQPAAITVSVKFN